MEKNHSRIQTMAIQVLVSFVIEHINTETDLLNSVVQKYIKS